jgi:ribosomal protein S18 acetylase RimI-like enzyme
LKEKIGTFSEDPAEMKPTVRPLEAEDKPWVEKLLEEHWGSVQSVSCGKMYDASRLPGFIAMVKDERAGLATYRMESGSCELVTLNSVKENRGVGTALLDAVKQAAIEAGCTRLWLITTNDNLEALGFYQKRGFSLVALRPGAIEYSRKLKPAIPETGFHGIPIRDELELEVLL